MNIRFDHVVIAVRDLDTAIRRYQHLGFEVTRGGKHIGRGTHNAIIRFGLDYIELLSVYDEAEARTNSPGGQRLLNFLSKRDELLLGYALATSEIEQAAEHFRRSELFVAEPFAMQRTLPDGEQLVWQLFIPSGVAWRTRWPFFIQWDTPADQRLLLEQPVAHPNGAIAWTQTAVAVRNLGSALDLYQYQLGLELKSSEIVPHLTARRATFRIGNASIDLLTPDGNGLVQEALTEIGEGPFEIRLAIKDLEQGRRFLTEQEIRFEPEGARPDTLLISPNETPGVRLILVSQEAAKSEEIPLNTLKSGQEGFIHQ